MTVSILAKMACNNSSWQHYFAGMTPVRYILPSIHLLQRMRIQNVDTFFPKKAKKIKKAHKISYGSR
jgi:hypothetical protein